MNQNIILKTRNEVKLFLGYVKTEIARKKKYTYIIITENDYFDFFKLESYLLDNDLNDYAKRELLNLAQWCDQFLELDDDYRKIEDIRGYSYHFQNKEKGYNYFAFNCYEPRYYYNYKHEKLVRLVKVSEVERLLDVENKKLVDYSYHKLFNKIRELLILLINYLDLKNIDEIRKGLKIDNEIELDIKPEQNRFNHIFEGNAFEVWQSMFDEFEINESKRTDVKFMFEIMKDDGLIHKTVRQKDFLNWITEAHDGLIVEKTSTYNKSIVRLKAYERAKELYKN